MEKKVPFLTGEGAHSHKQELPNNHFVNIVITVCSSTAWGSPWVEQAGLGGWQESWSDGGLRSCKPAAGKEGQDRADVIRCIQELYVCDSGTAFILATPSSPTLYHWSSLRSDLLPPCRMGEMRVRDVIKAGAFLMKLALHHVHLIEFDSSCLTRVAVLKQWCDSRRQEDWKSPQTSVSRRVVKNLQSSCFVEVDKETHYDWNKQLSCLRISVVSAIHQRQSQEGEIKQLHTRCSHPHILILTFVG